MKKVKYLIFLLLLIYKTTFSQLTVGNYSGCPNQIITVNASWPNVSITSLSLNIPGGSGPVGNFVNTTFTISHPGPGCPNFTLYGTGIQNGLPVAQQATLNYCVVPPAALTITNNGNNGNNVNYCFGETAVLIAPLGGTLYTISGPGGAIPNPNPGSPVFNIGPLTAGNTGTYLITSIGGCTATGVGTINVAPNNQLTVSQVTNVCQGGSFSLTANLTNGTGYQWTHQNGPLAPGANQLVQNVTPNQGGVYSCSANIVFNSILCPVTQTTQANVVQTSPIAVAASPNSILCQNDKLNLIANAGNGAYAYSWTGPSNFSSLNQNPTINQVSPNNQGTYSVSAFFTNSIITCSTTATVSVQVVSVVIPVISMPSSTCQNTSLSFSVTAGANVQAFSWVGPNFNSILPVNTINNISTSASGLYYVTAKYGLNTTTCAATASAQLNVIPVNSVSVIPPAPVCQPNNANLQASAIGANLYTWAGPNGFAISGSNPTIYYPTPSASGVYTVTAFFGSGNITCTNSNTVSLSVYPVLYFSLVPRQQVCYNTALQVSGPAGATSYTWTSSTGFTSNTKDLNFSSVQPNNSGTYTLNVSMGPCVSGAATSIVVLTPIQYTLFPQNRTVCRGDTTILEGGVTGGSENYAYTWSPSLFLDIPTGPIQKCVPLGSMIYNLIAHDIACPNYTIAHTFSVNVNQPPVPELQLSQVEGCAPFKLLLDNKTQKESFTVTYDFGGLKQIQKDSAAGSFNYTLPEAGVYTLNISTLGYNKCAGKFQYPDLITVNPRPSGIISTDPEVPTTNDEIKFIPSAVNGPIVRHSWMFLGGSPTLLDSAYLASIASGFDTSNVENPIRKYETVGNYPVMLISETDKGCIDTVFRALLVTDDLRLYVPNAFTPNGDGINDGFGVKGTGMKLEGFFMELSDRWGNIVYSSKDINASWDGNFNGQKCKDGSYIYRIRVVGINGEGRKEYVGHFTLLK